jgi:hypothetical protein
MDDIKNCGNRAFYLNKHPETAKNTKAKAVPWKLYEHDRDGYTEQKTGFVRKVTEQAFAHVWKGELFIL